MVRRLIIPAILAILAVAGCGPLAPRRDIVLRIASQKGGTRALLEASHVLVGAPYRVEWSEFPSAQTLLEAVSDGAADVGGAGDAPFLFAYASGARIEVLQALRYGADGSTVAIIAPIGSSIHSTGDLKGRRIATGRGSIGHYLLLRVLESAGLTPKDVDIVYLSPGDAKAALGSGAVDAWASWDPYVALAVLQGEDRIVVTGKGLLHDISFQAVNRTALTTKRAALDDLVQRMDRAYAWEAGHVHDYAAALAKDTGLPPGVSTVMTAHLLPHPVRVDDALIAEERDTLRHFQAAGVIARSPDVKAALEETAGK